MSVYLSTYLPIDRGQIYLSIYPLSVEAARSCGCPADGTLIIPPALCIYHTLTVFIP